MILSITRSAAAALVVGSVLLVAASDGQAAMTAAEKHEAALEACANLMKGQRSYCVINANNQYTLDKAAEDKSEGSISYDFDDTNDTPEQTAAKEDYNTAASKCMDLSKGQRSFCMIEAQNKYQEGSN